MAVPAQTLLAEQDRIIGVAMAALLVRMNTGEMFGDGWVHVRAERLSLVNVTTVRRDATVDFTYPLGLPPVARMVMISPAPLVPLTLFTKGRPLAGFSVQDEDARRLSVLTRVESARQGARCLVGLAQTAATIAGAEVPKPVADAFAQVARLPGDQAADLLARMRYRVQLDVPNSGGIFGDTWDDFAPSENPSQAVREALRNLERHAVPLYNALAEPTLNVLARSFARQFMLLTSLPPERLGERRSLSFGLNEDYRLSGEVSRAMRNANAVREGIGWRPADYEFEVPSVARAQRYQAEVVPPPTLQIVSAELRIVDPRRRTASPIATVTAGASESGVVLQSAGDVQGGFQGTVVVRLQPSRIGLLRVAPFGGVLIAIVLLIGKARLKPISGGDTATAAALLLAVPALFAALLARPGEHALATRLLFGTRGLVIVSGLATFVAAASLAGRWSVHTKHVMWNWAAWSTVAATALLLAGLATNWRRWRRGEREALRISETDQDP